MNAEDHFFYMRRCIELATLAKLRGDSPVGALIASHENIIGEGMEAGKTQKDITFHAEIEGGSPKENAEILRRTLRGEERGAKADIVMLNAMFALYTANVVKHPMEAKPLIEEAIKSGKVWDNYQLMIDSL